MAERTLAIIKPDAISAKNSGAIISEIEKNGFAILRMEKIELARERAERFYAVHKERPFFDSLIALMTSGPIIVMALEKENAIADWRTVMGDTDPAKAAEGTIRKRFGTNIGDNATHGSDGPETAREEVAFFFPDL